MIPIRLALTLALALTPDDRPATRRALVKAAATTRRQPAARLSRKQEVRVLGGLDGWPRRWAIFGIVVLRLLLRRPWIVVLAIVALVVAIAQLVIALAR